MYKNNLISKDLATTLKGFSAIMIIISHIIDKKYPFYLQGLKYGAIWVSFFFFLSGYGLIISYKNKKDYLNGFISNKIVKLYIPFVIAELFYIIANIVIFSKQYSVIDVLLGIIGIKLINTSLWFMQNLFIFYFLFYIIYKSNINKKTIIMVSIVAIYIVIAIAFDKTIGINTWWYLSTPCFILGLLIGENKESLTSHLKDKRITLLMASFLLLSIILFYYLTKASYHGSNSIISNNNYYIILLEMIISPFFVISVVFLSIRFSIKCNIMYRIGIISMELYFYHRIIVNVFKMILSINNCFLEIALTLLISLLLALIMNKINSKIITMIWRKKNEN